MTAVLVETSAGVDENRILGHARRFGCDGRRQATDEQFDASEVVLKVGISAVEATDIGFPHEFNRTYGGVFGHLPEGEHFVGLVGGEGGELVGGNGPVGKRQPCVAGHGGGDASILDGDFNVQIVAGQDVEARNRVELRGRADVADASFAIHHHGPFVRKHVKTHEEFVERDGCGPHSVAGFGHQPVARIVEQRGRRINRIPDVNNGPSTAVGRRGQ